MQVEKLRAALELSRSSFKSIGLFSALVNILALIPTLYMIEITGRVIPTSSALTLVMLTIILTVLLVAMSSLELVRSLILVRVGNRMDALIGRDAYRSSFRNALKSGGANSTAQSLNDLSSLKHFLTGPSVFTLFDAPWFPIYTVVMFLFHPWFGCLTLASGFVLAILAYLNHRGTSNSLAEANKENVTANLATSKILRNAEVIESMGMLETLMDRWLASKRKILKLQSKASDNSGVVSTISKTYRIWSQSIMLSMGAYLVITKQLDASYMMAGSLLLGRALAPIDQIINNWKNVVVAKVQYERLSKELENLSSEPERMKLPTPEGHIQVEGLTVAPPGAKAPVLRNVSFIVPAGSIVGIVGPSAAGKSTLARALMGIWPKQHGVVRLDGADISTWDKQELGPFVGYLPQDIELFEGSIRDNISRFEEGDLEKIVHAAQLAGVHEMILMLPDGYDTVIGSAGINLSGGQRQRIGLARAVYGSPRLIVLDEPNSNLDELGEQALGAALHKLKASGSTVFIVSHRPNILNHLDRIVVMSGGTVSLCGERDKVLTHLAQQQVAAQKRPAQQPSKSVPIVQEGSSVHG